VSCDFAIATHRVVYKLKAIFETVVFLRIQTFGFKECEMGNVKLIVIYPGPKDIESFERLYKNEHVPMAVEKLGGKTKIVASKIVGSPQGAPPFHRIAEIHFASMEALQACAASDGGKQTLANAVAISSGGAPIFLVAEEEVFVFQGKCVSAES
jgi:uncharacterized protein (TIGR02118 family)